MAYGKLAQIITTTVKHQVDAEDQAAFYLTLRAYPQANFNQITFELTNSEIDDSDGEVEIDDVSDGEYPQEDEEYSGISFEEEQNLRARYLAQLKRLNQRGMVSQRRFGPEDSSGSIKAEVLRLKKEKEVEKGINYCKQGLV